MLILYNIMLANRISPVFDANKAIQVVLYVANKLKRRDFHKIFKVIYFADKAHLAEWGRTVSADTYIAMEAGPVPTKIYDMFKVVRGDSLFSSNEEMRAFYNQFFKVEGDYILVPQKGADMKYLSKSDVDALDKSLAENKDLSFDAIKDKSHDFAWSQTARDQAIDFAYMLFEEGASEEYVKYVKESMLLDNYLARKNKRYEHR